MSSNLGQIDHLVAPPGQQIVVVADGEDPDAGVGAVGLHDPLGPVGEAVGVGFELNYPPGAMDASCSLAPAGAGGMQHGVAMAGLMPVGAQLLQYRRGPAAVPIRPRPDDTCRSAW